MTVVILIAIAIGLFFFGKLMLGAVHRAGGGFDKNEEFVMEHGFKGRARVRMETLEDGREIEVFQFQIKGIIVGESEQWHGFLRVGAVDVTEDPADPYPVLCAIDELQKPETCILEFCSDGQQLSEVSYIEEWMTLFQVPVEALQFARRGRRRLVFFFGVTDQNDNQLQQNHDQVEVEYDASEPGFVEMEAVQAEVDRMTVQLAFLVSAADGELDQAEGAVVQNWIKKRLSLEDDDASKQSKKDDLNEAIRSAGALRDDPAGNVATLSRTIVRKGVHAHRYDALELCLEVAGADGTAEATEMELIEKIAENLRIDANRLKEMVHKSLPVGMFADKDPDAILGITERMSESEIKSLLNAEYRKWNSRVNHSDKAVQAQASEMLNLIADARKRHIG